MLRKLNAKQYFQQLEHFALDDAFLQKQINPANLFFLKASFHPDDIDTGALSFLVYKKNLFDFMEKPPATLGEFFALSQNLLPCKKALQEHKKQKVAFFDVRIDTPFGEIVWFDMQFHIIDIQNDCINVEGFLLEKTLSKIHKKKLSLTYQLFKSNHDGIFIANDNCLITDINPRFTRITGITAREILKYPFRLKQDLSGDICYDKLGDILLTSEHSDRRFTRPLKITVQQIKDYSDQSKSYIGIVSSAKETKQNKALYLVEHDFLTGLANRNLMLTKLKSAINTAQKTNQSLAVLFLDLDNFKKINDTLGHAIGDRILQKTALRITQCIRKDDIACRLGGDEFVVVLTSISSENDAHQAASHLLQTLSDNYQLRHYLLSAKPSIGIAMYPHDGRRANTLINHADSAMYQAKSNGGAQIAFYNKLFNFSN